MATYKGNAITFTWDGSAIAAVRQVDLNLSGEPIDITSNDSSGWRTLLTVSAEDQVSITVSGLTDTISVLKDDFFNDKANAVVLTQPTSSGDTSGDSISGTFFLSSFSEGIPYNDASSFTAELQSSGTITFTAGT